MTTRIPKLPKSSPWHMKLRRRLYNFAYDFVQLIYHRQVIKELQDQLNEPFETRLKRIEEKNGEVTTVLESPLFKALTVAIFTEILDKDIKNHIVVDMVYVGHKFQLTVQIADKKTPLERIREMEIEINSLRTKLSVYVPVPVPIPDVPSRHSEGRL